ncbi:FHA domain-containing protein [Lysobacter solisilvae (ex Woo and Kim 2020)]|uniref:FHA domain-containing protein n=1 Tax=Agrilutibacter terrestris TaxID=2865112 RepID=A0A7H0FVS0_9GAMM|nr:FHA domain-containing protein [Lysobacter terrestris]QNP40136.1 FHA domain-containing protein [Lysobacter terrestris]
MQARLTAYPPDAAALSRWLQPGMRLRIGRDPGCDLVIEHPSVSRAHAELSHDGSDWRLRDLGSKNGSFVDGIPVSDHPIRSDCWLRLGDCYCDFGVFDAVQAAALQAHRAERVALSQALAHRISLPGSRGDSLPAQVLRGVVELSGSDRGFLLLADPGTADFSVRASLQLDAQALDQRAFSGSVGAVQRVLTEGRPLVVNDVGNEGWLAGRASVVAGALCTLVCLPLRDGARVIGAVYADRRSAPDGSRGEPVTDFDMELIGAFAESATLYLLASRAVQSLDDAPRWQTIVDGQSDRAPRAGTA